MRELLFHGNTKTLKLVLLYFTGNSICRLSGAISFITSSVFKEKRTMPQVSTIFSAKENISCLVRQPFQIQWQSNIARCNRTPARPVQISSLFRHFDKNYHAMWANPFAEGSSAANETGLYFGIRILPVKFVSLSAYSDMYRSEWINFTTTGSHHGDGMFLHRQISVLREK